MQHSSGLDIGFNGAANQFDYFADFYGASALRAGRRLCHGYVGWKVAYEQPTVGDDQSKNGTRAAFEYWLTRAIGHCDEALISFQSHTPGPPPSESEFADAMKKFLETPWAQETGFTGPIALAPWNEPNNPAPEGNGLGQRIDADTAARYFLALSRLCAQHDCDAVAGDFASNGNMWNDFEWNCADDNVPRAELCKTPSSANPQGRPPSYLDLYKNYIANHADEYGLGSQFRPKYFAYHGWHDVNEYLYTGDHCGDYEHCATRRVIKSLGGSWSGVEIWDDEVGIDQSSTPIPDDLQACGAAFLVRLTQLSPRIRRIYYTRLHNGGGELLHGHMPRPAMYVLAHREQHYADNCK